ncbi:hypothetical protein [Cellulomonas sp. B6]|uniref:hypothetical protein n=1 Tax=Cellulomonas sp. B6 TaxID=1295626 RepID=UPI00073C63D7|nr:hypothetical protein [Cellulomonas sp. B6]KSW29331.1 hypothetical protein ATM99_08800 [Cellulomonas sp. B6]
MATLFERLEGAPVDGALTYDIPAHSFLFEPLRATCSDEDRSTGLAALTIGTLQLHVGAASGRVYFVDGYHEVRSRWSSAVVRPPEPRPGVVRVRGGDELLSGVGYTLAPGGVWRTSVDEVSGWVQVADPSAAPAQDVVLVATGTVLGLAEGRLLALWLRPSTWDERADHPVDGRRRRAEPGGVLASFLRRRRRDKPEAGDRASWPASSGRGGPVIDDDVSVRGGRCTERVVR